MSHIIWDFILSADISDSLYSDPGGFMLGFSLGLDTDCGWTFCRLPWAVWGRGWMCLVHLVIRSAPSSHQTLKYGGAV